MLKSEFGEIRYSTPFYSLQLISAIQLSLSSLFLPIHLLSFLLFFFFFLSLDDGDSEMLLESLKITEEKSARLDDILVGEGLVGFVVLGVLEKNLVHVGARILIQLVTRTEDNQSDLAVAQYRQLVRLLHYPELPFVEGHLLEDQQKSIISDRLSRPS